MSEISASTLFDGVLAAREKLVDYLIDNLDDLENPGQIKGFLSVNTTALTLLGGFINYQEMEDRIFAEREVSGSVGMVRQYFVEVVDFLAGLSAAAGGAYAGAALGSLFANPATAVIGSIVGGLSASITYDLFISDEVRDLATLSFFEILGDLIASNPEFFNDVLVGGTKFNDNLASGGAPAEILGREGDDVLTGANSNDTIYGGVGLDRIEGRGGQDDLRGEGDIDAIYGGASNDTIYGGLEGDELYGGTEDDLIVGEEGFDFLDGGSGADNLFGGDERDLLYGGTGNDSLHGEGGNDDIFGGNDEDIAFYTYSAEKYQISTAVGGVTVNSKTFEDTDFVSNDVEFIDLGGDRRSLSQWLDHYGTSEPAEPNPTPEPNPNPTPGDTGSPTPPDGFENASLSVTKTNVEIAPGQSIALTSLYNPTGWVDGDAPDDIIWFAVQDRTQGGGFLTRDGQALNDEQVYEARVDEIGLWRFQAGSGSSVDEIGFNIIQADGDFSPSFADGSAAKVTTTAPPPDQPDEPDQPTASGRGDFKATITDISATSFIPGQRIEVRVEVENVGDKTILGYDAGVYISSDEDIDTSDQRIGIVDIDTLSVNEVDSGRIEYTLPSNFIPGTYWIGAIADYEDRAAENSETNNVDSVRVTIGNLPANLPDLELGFVRVPNTRIIFDEEFQLRYTVYNYGGADSARSDVSFYLSRNKSFNPDDDLFLANNFFGRSSDQSGVPANDRDSESQDLRISKADLERINGNSDPDDIYLLMVIDEDEDVVESNRDNNITALRMSIGNTEDDIPGSVDFFAYGLEFTPERVIPGQKAPATVSLENIGSIDPASFDQRVDFKLVSETTGAETIVGFGSVFDLGLRLSRSGPVTLTNEVSFSSSLSPGYYQLKAVSRTDAAELPSDLQNNTSNSIRVFVGTEEQQALLESINLETQSFDAISNSDGTYEVSANVANTGYASTAIPWAATLFLERNGDPSTRVTLVSETQSALPGDPDQNGAASASIAISFESVEIPALSAPGSYSFVFEADATSQIDEIDETDNDAVQFLTIVNAVPNAVDETVTVQEDGTLTGSLSALDEDGDPLTYSTIQDEAPAHGVVEITAEGAFTYSPNSNFNGEDSFGFIVSDGKGGMDTGEITISVESVNDLPVANGAFFEGSEDVAITGQLSASDEDGSLVYAIAPGGEPANGQVEIDPNGAFSYAPAANFFGNDSFTFFVSDAVATDEAVINLAVASVNDAPSIKDDVFTVQEGGVLTGALFADNGNGADADVDGDDIAVGIAAGRLPNTTVALPSGALLLVNPNGAFSYDTNGAFAGLVDGETTADSFEYIVSDGFGGSGTATVTVNVQGNSLLPVDGENPTPPDSPTDPGTPTIPEEPTDPGTPTIPEEPTDPSTPTSPEEPMDPGTPTIPGEDGPTTPNEGETPDPTTQYAGTSGPDSFNGTSQAEEMDGGRGNDTMNAGGGNDTMSGGGGRDVMDGGRGRDDLSGNGGKDTLIGGGGRDTLDGGGGKDDLSGGGGRDLLIGGGGKDTLDGGGGKDTLVGGRGKDELTGGRGRDVFEFNQGDGYDAITDFQHSADKISIVEGAEEFADLVVRQIGDDVLIRAGNVRIRVEDDDVAAFDATDFIF